MDRPPTSSKAASGFTLVEVVLAMGIVGFAVVAVLGLLSVGLDQYRTAVDTTVCSQIGQRLINDAQQADFSKLIDYEHTQARANNPEFTFRWPLEDKPKFRYFDEQGGEIVSDSEDGVLTPEQSLKVLYWVNIRIRPCAQLPRGEIATRPNLAQVTVEVAHYAGGAPLEINGKKGDSGHNLFVPRAGVPIFTFSALVGRNDI